MRYRRSVFAVVVGMTVVVALSSGSVLGQPPKVSPRPAEFDVVGREEREDPDAGRGPTGGRRLSAGPRRQAGSRGGSRRS